MMQSSTVKRGPGQWQVEYENIQGNHVPLYYSIAYAACPIASLPPEEADISKKEIPQLAGANGF